MHKTFVYFVSRRAGGLISYTSEFLIVKHRLKETEWRSERVQAGLSTFTHI